MSLTELTGKNLMCECGKEFYCKPSFIKRGAKYCSRKCYLRFRLWPQGEEHSCYKHIGEVKKKVLASEKKENIKKVKKFFSRTKGGEK